MNKVSVEMFKFYLLLNKSNSYQLVALFYLLHLVIKNSNYYRYSFNSHLLAIISLIPSVG